MHTLVAIVSTLFCGGALTAIPRWRKARRQRHAVEAKLLGSPAVTDRNGREITPAVKSFSEELADFRAELLARPALNGEWNRLFAYVSGMHSTLHQHLADPDAHQ